MKLSVYISSYLSLAPSPPLPTPTPHPPLSTRFIIYKIRENHHQSKPTPIFLCISKLNTFSLDQIFCSDPSPLTQPSSHQYKGRGRGREKCRDCQKSTGLISEEKPLYLLQSKELPPGPVVYLVPVVGGGGSFTFYPLSLIPSLI